MAKCIRCRGEVGDEAHICGVVKSSYPDSIREVDEQMVVEILSKMPLNVRKEFISELAIIYDL